MADATGVMRAAARIGIYPAVAGAAFGDFFVSGAAATLAERTSWLKRCAILHQKWIGFCIRVRGEIPKSGLIVANHVSYLDIVGLSAVVGCAFVSKKEVGQWPVFGAYAKLGGTIFVDRERRAAVDDVGKAMQSHLDQHVPVVLFPEGTSSGGESVLPFRTSLFEPAALLGCPVVPCGIRYTLPGGSVPDEVAYWGDMELPTHLPRLLTKTGLVMEIHFGAARSGRDRKELARLLRADVCDLAGLPR